MESQNLQYHPKPFPTIIGAIAGDIIGSVYEWDNTKTTDFDLFCPKCDFTDDTVLTIAVADALLNDKDYAETLKYYARRYPDRGYGGWFLKWLGGKSQRPYNSYGNGSAMRTSPVGFYFKSPEEVLEKASQVSSVSHNHPEGIKGAQAVSCAVFLARTGKTKEYIKQYIQNNFKYDLSYSLSDIRQTYGFDVSCQGSVGQAIVAFLESKDYESAVRLAVSIGGDSDTIACMTGGMASAFYRHIPKVIIDFSYSRLPSEFISIIEEFDQRTAARDYETII